MASKHHFPAQSSTDKSLGLTVLRLSEAQNSGFDYFSEQPAILDSYVNILITKGSGGMRIDFEHYNLQAGTLVFLSRGQHVQFLQTSGIDAIVFVASQKYLDEMFDGRGLRPFL